MSLETEVKPTIRALPAPNIYTTFTQGCTCDWCDQLLQRGVKVNIFAPQEFTGFMRDLLTRITAGKKIPIEVSILISKFLFKTN